MQEQQHCKINRWIYLNPSKCRRQISVSERSTSQVMLNFHSSSTWKLCSVHHSAGHNAHTNPFQILCYKWIDKVLALTWNFICISNTLIKKQDKMLLTAEASKTKLDVLSRNCFLISCMKMTNRRRKLCKSKATIISFNIREVKTITASDDCIPLFRE